MIYPEPAADLPAVHSYKTPPVRQIQIAFFIFLNECFKLTTFLDMPLKNTFNNIEIGWYILDIK